MSVSADLVRATNRTMSWKISQGVDKVLIQDKAALDSNKPVPLETRETVAGRADNHQGKIGNTSETETDLHSGESDFSSLSSDDTPDPSGIPNLNGQSGIGGGSQARADTAATGARSTIPSPNTSQRNGGSPQYVDKPLLNSAKSNSTNRVVKASSTGKSLLVSAGGNMSPEELQEEIPSRRRSEISDKRVSLLHRVERHSREQFDDEFSSVSQSFGELEKRNSPSAEGKDSSASNSRRPSLKTTSVSRDRMSRTRNNSSGSVQNESPNATMTPSTSPSMPIMGRQGIGLQDVVQMAGKDLNSSSIAHRMVHPSNPGTAGSPAPDAQIIQEKLNTIDRMSSEIDRLQSIAAEQEATIRDQELEMQETCSGLELEIVRLESLNAGLETSLKEKEEEIRESRDTVGKLKKALEKASSRVHQSASEPSLNQATHGSIVALEKMLEESQATVARVTHARKREVREYKKKLMAQERLLDKTNHTIRQLKEEKETQRKHLDEYRERIRSFRAAGLDESLADSEIEMLRMELEMERMELDIERGDRSKEAARVTELEAQLDASMKTEVDLRLQLATLRKESKALASEFAERSARLNRSWERKLADFEDAAHAAEAEWARTFEIQSAHAERQQYSIMLLTQALHGEAAAGGCPPPHMVSHRSPPMGAVFRSRSREQSPFVSWAPDLDDPYRPGPAGGGPQVLHSPSWASPGLHSVAAHGDNHPALSMGHLSRSRSPLHDMGEHRPVADASRRRATSARGPGPGGGARQARFTLLTGSEEAEDGDAALSQLKEETRQRLESMRASHEAFKSLVQDRLEARAAATGLAPDINR